MTEPLMIRRQAPARRIELDETSWVDVVDGFVVGASVVFAELHESVPWRQDEVLRYERYVPERRLNAAVRSSSFPVLRQVELHLEARYRVGLSGVAGLLYRTGDDFQGLHSDREMRWLDDTIVAIVVLGQRRPFVIRRRADGGPPVDRIPAGSHPDDLVLLPGEGDMLVMGGACQRDWLHGIPVAPTANPRISLTWRWSSRRGRPDTNPTYYDGRQYSGAPRRPGVRTSPEVPRRPG